MSQSKAFKKQSRKSFIGILLLTFCTFLAQGVLAAATDTSYAEHELHKDNEFSSLVKRPAFFVGSRYGRSSGNPASASGGTVSAGMGTSKTRRLIIVPRNDRFFLGSRYGKRSDEYLSPYEQNSLGIRPNKESLRDTERFVDNDDTNEKPNNGPRPSTLMSMTMSCYYTGISNFYRCNNINAENQNRGEAMAIDSNSIASDDGNTK